MHVVRADPTKVGLELLTASGIGGAPRKASEWCQERKLAVAINAGMFQDDHKTNVGFLRSGSHQNNPHLNAYRSLLVFDPSEPKTGPLRLVDLDAEDGATALRLYKSGVQNLRLIKADRVNVWAPSERAWSEAAIGTDESGRLLLVFSRAPYSMREFNRVLLDLPLDVRAAMHVEGGPEASLSIHAGGVDLDLAGSYETSFNENDLNLRQWALPNVLGVKLADR
jgi:hypothetical protein